MAVRSPKLLAVAVRGTQGHPAAAAAAAAAADLASEKVHLLAKRPLFSTITGGGGGRYGPR